MNRKIIIFGGIGVVLLAGALFFYFFYLGNPSRQVLANVNDEQITLDQLNKELEKVAEPQKTMYQEEPEKLVEGIIVKALLIQEAKKQGIKPPIKTYKDAGKEDLSPEDAMIAELMKSKFSKPPEVSKEEIAAFYSMFKGQMGERS